MTLYMMKGGRPLWIASSISDVHLHFGNKKSLNSTYIIQWKQMDFNLIKLETIMYNV